MNTYKITYNGNATKFKNFETLLNAESERGAVEDVYADYLDQDYFPQDDGSILDCDGNIIADPDDDQIEYDGGYFTAELIEDDHVKVQKMDYEVYSFSSGYFGICKKGEHGGNCVHGGDSANDDDYDEDYMNAVFEEWDGTLHYDSVYGYLISK